MSSTQSVFAPANDPVLAISRADRADGAQDRFIREKLFLTSLIVVTLPLGLAFHGAPSFSEAMLFAAALLPLAAALHLARGNRLLVAQVCAAAGEIAIALLVSVAAGAGAAFAWIVVALVEIALAFDRRLLRHASLVIALAAGTSLALDGVASGSHASEASAVAALCALLVGILMSWRFPAGGTRGEGRGTIRRERDTALIEALGDAVVVFDAGGALVAAMRGLEAKLGAKPGELSGRAFFDLVNVADRPILLKLLGDAVHDGGTRCGTLRLRTMTFDRHATGYGEPRTLVFDVRAHACESASRGAAAEIVAVMRDVTESHRREAEIEAAQRAIDTALQAKDHFLANMSHELRTPLNAIIGFSEMLGSRTMSPNDPAKQREYAGIIHQSGQHLLSVVNSILDMSKIQSGTFALIPEPFPLLALAEQCCDVVRLQAQNGRVEIVRDVPEDLEEIVADRRACRQILINLLSNAVKFTPQHGRVTLRVRPEGTALRIAVDDGGIGIGEADLVRLGDPFFQARSCLSRPYEGTGLGLSVVRGLVGLHGGTITIESEIGKGTNVTVRLPLDCRLNAATTNVAIETIPRRAAPEPLRPFEFRPASDPRMKQSA